MVAPEVEEGYPMRIKHLILAGATAAGLAAGVAVWTAGAAQTPSPSPNAGFAFSNGWLPVGMNTTGDPTLPSIAWFYNRDDGRVVACQHGADAKAPPVCSPAARLP
jgi:hypothetical protein